ncbi:uncharacterized protein LOC133186637 [Saccostrea echinata]|uniref:uncharacterized protein LOC133186637 n=1 Tax=Saccostrea echinata TaxID=191078 RepID=UPI002A80586A|nr:uncharacterized protein LOC133186637 [Saccostrea echinata]
MAKLEMDIQKYHEEVNEVEMITKRALGKMVVRHVGNEGIGEQSDLRRLFQACIDFIQKTNPIIWSDASITIYDDENDQIFTIKSGKARHQYICSMRDNEPTITQRAVNEAGRCCQM